MRLIHSGYNLKIDFIENEVNILVIENRTVMMELMQELYIQNSGQEGQFVFSDSDKILKMDKDIELIINPFIINCNERKILTALYRELEELALENYTKESIEMSALLVDYVEKVSFQVPYHIAYLTEYSPTAFLKLADLHIESSAVDVAEKIIEYVTLMKQICGIKLFIFWNLKSLLSDDTMKMIYQHVSNNKITLLLIENFCYSTLSGEKVTIIDIDRCIIAL